MIERIKQIAAQIAGEIATTRVGFVYDYDQTTYSVRVQFQPSGEITGWIPIGTQWVGNSFGMAVGPGIGDMVRVDHLEGDGQVAMIGARYFNDSAAPLQVPSGECWFVHASGSLLKFHNDGTVELTASSTLTSTAPQWNHTGPVHITGDVLITGNETVTLDIYDRNATKGTLQHIRDNYDVHTHGGVQTGGGNTGTPNNSL